MCEPCVGKSEEQYWSDFLDTLDVEVNEAMTLADGDILSHHSVWFAPESLPPLPREAVTRVSQLIEMQRELLAQLKSNREQAHKLRRFTEVDATRGMQGGPYFIDTQI